MTQVANGVVKNSGSRFNVIQFSCSRSHYTSLSIEVPLPICPELYKSTYVLRIGGGGGNTQLLYIIVRIGGGGGAAHS